MIISGQKKAPSSSLWAWTILLLLAICIATLALNLKKEKQFINPTNVQIVCDAETIQDNYFINDEIKFSGGNLQSKVKAHAGDYSMLLTVDHRTGMKYTIDLPEQGSLYKVGIWKYGKNTEKGFLVVEAEPPAIMSKKVSEHIDHDSEWWQRIEFLIAIPQDTFIESLHIYASNEGDQQVYFDDLYIEKIADGINNKKATFFNKKIKLLLENDALEHLAQQRKQAIKDGVFIRDEHSEIKAAILEANQKHKISLRYKGDWLDHILSSQPSYRIECKSDFTWNGMQSFSIQHPKTRGYLREWIYHDLLDEIEVLSPRYDFIKAEVNQNQPQVYALEEHFNKYLVEHKKRREGPIIKLTEDEFWEGMVRHSSSGKGLAPTSNKNRAFNNSDISPFKASRTAKDPTLINQFEIAQNLVHRYKNGVGTVAETFDIDKLAKFMAISELCMAGHSLTWHNQRFYYNPVISLLEPIGFDCSRLGDDIHAFESPLYIEHTMIKRNDANEPINKIYEDKQFLKLLFHYLDQYSQPLFINTYLAHKDFDINKREKLLQESRAEYKYKREELIDRAKKIQISIKPYKNALKVFRESETDGSITVKFINSHNLPLEVKPTGSKDAESFIVLPQRERIIPNFYTRDLPKRTKNMSYRLPGEGAWTEVAIAAWTTPDLMVPRLELFDKKYFADSTLFVRDGIKLIVHQGTHVISRPTVIPAGHILYISPATTFEFKNDGFIISASPIVAEGTRESPIRFIGNGTNGSITILQADGPSTLSYVIFNNQNTMAFKGWKLTGAVTFYESDVAISYCKFINNTCEDGLNIVRSNFDVSWSEFNNIYSDAFDADFCEGKLSHSSFRNTGNDAIDFSTSLIDVRHCQMNDIGDKAISAGEQATIDAMEITVHNANIAFASKDRSVLTLHNVTITDCDKGFTAYQKKPEFGPATIKVYGMTEQNTKNLFLIEEGSTLIK